MESIAAIILAAGQGTRMKSSLPKVLHKVAGQPLINFSIHLAVTALRCERVVVVVGHGRELVEDEVKRLDLGKKLSFAVQSEQKGTGHAVMCGLEKLRSFKGRILVLSGDVPLLDKTSVSRLVKAYNKVGGPLAFLSFYPSSADGYGRVLRENGKPMAIREHRDCTADERKIGEVNSGVYLIDSRFLKKSIKGIGVDNDQGELYLTDLVEMAAKRGTVAVQKADPEVVAGVNDRVDLAMIETILRRQTNHKLMLSGVTMRQPETIQVDVGVEVEADVEIGPNVHLAGRTKIAHGARIGTGSVIVDSIIGADAVIKPYTIIEEAKVEFGAEIGPMGRLRPGALIGPKAKVGNFVEVKNTVMGAGAKANHLAYLGDGHVGERANVGAGTIFCNYDGFQKHKTVLGDDVFIGSDSQLIAPVVVGNGAYVASGTTVTRDVPPDDLAISRVRQENKKGLAAILKKRLQAAKKASKGKK